MAFQLHVHLIDHILNDPSSADLNDWLEMMGFTL
jgi:hypothetical protein